MSLLTVVAAALGSILPGVTRASVIQIARDLGYKVEECQLSIEDALASQVRGGVLGLAS